MELRRGAVVLAVTPGDFGKVRPGVVVQSDAVLWDHPTVVVCPMTSDLRGLRLRVSIVPDAANGLQVASEVMVDKVSALAPQRIRDTIGQLSADDLAAVDRALVLLLGLSEGQLTTARSPR